MLKSKRNLLYSYYANKELLELINDVYPELGIYLYNSENYISDGFTIHNDKLIQVEFKQRQDTMIGDYLYFNKWKFSKYVRLFAQNIVDQLITEVEESDFKPFWVIIYDKTYSGFILLDVSDYKKLIELKGKIKKNGFDRTTKSKCFLVPLENFKKFKIDGVI